ncbi:MAG TPA: HlyD family efflux transporter periplasmic adaptor subunit [Bacteroides sp.]|nr:HlyD family efflux transporter periplasmic adaptor subunit [Bacteroides sp.]
MKRKTLIAIIIPVVLVGALILYSVLSGKEKDVVLETAVKYGQFEIAVMVTGELEAIRETEITAPQELRSRNLRIRSVPILELIPEGTVVDSGDWVATLDRSEADNTLKDILDNLEQEESEYMRTRLDTTMQLRQLRDELINLEFAMEEAGIALEQSKFEPPATIRQAEINLEKARRAYEQAKQNYTLRVQQSRAEMREAEINLARDRRRKEEMEAVLNKFDIRAPASGMVIYKRDWDGTKRTAGTEINTWDLTVATLPDLSTMISTTYVNEIDISKVDVGQPVRVGVDAFPDKKYTGRVIEVANIGQQLSNTDAKVFEVRIEVNEYDSILRPSMTTSNQIVTSVLEDVLSLPLEAVHANDSVTFVYTRDGKRQIVLVGPSNENNIVIEKGLEPGEMVYLSVPEEPESFEFTGMALMDEIKKRKEEEMKEAEKRQQQRQRPMIPEDIRRMMEDGELPEGFPQEWPAGDSGTFRQRPEGAPRRTPGERPEGAPVRTPGARPGATSMQTPGSQTQTASFDNFN